MVSPASQHANIEHLPGIHLLRTDAKWKLHLRTRGALSIIQVADDESPSIKLLSEWYVALVPLYLAPGMVTDGVYCLFKDTRE